MLRRYGNSFVHPSTQQDLRYSYSKYDSQWFEWDHAEAVQDVPQYLQLIASCAKSCEIAYWSRLWRTLMQIINWYDRFCSSTPLPLTTSRIPSSELACR